MEKRNIIFISYYTKNTIYEEIINKYLIPSLKKFHLQYHIFGIESFGSWKENAIQKPKILKLALEKFPNHDIFWEDADSEIRKYPELLFTIPKEIDIAVHYLEWKQQYGRKGDEYQREMLDGSVLWTNNIKNISFIDKLIVNSTNKSIDHQKTMAKMIKDDQSLCIYNLPREYSYILTQPDGSKPAVEIENPVIVHHQKSREAKRKLI